MTHSQTSSWRWTERTDLIRQHAYRVEDGGPSDNAGHLVEAGCYRMIWPGPMVVNRHRNALVASTSRCPRCERAVAEDEASR
jgi:hypothetical protein